VLEQFVARHVLRVLFLLHGDAMKTPLDECMNLVELTEQFGSDDKCRAALEQLRWNKGPVCPRCESKATKIANRFQYDCDSCHYQFSVTAGTIFHDSHLSLWKWFLATYLLTESRKGMSSNQLSRMLKVTYKTAWYLTHRIRAAMLEVAPEPLDGTVEIDETYVGGKKRRWRPKSEKAVVIGIRKRNGDLRLIRAKDAKASTIREIIGEHISEDVEVIMTDESAIYPWALNKMGRTMRHETINHTREYAHGNIHTNTIESAFSLLKRGIVGTWHKVSAKHLPAYLDEMCFRFNNRKNQFLFRDTLIKLILSPNVEYKELTAQQAEPAA
jgi:transposase-like protein